MVVCSRTITSILAACLDFMQGNFWRGPSPLMTASIICQDRSQRHIHQGDDRDIRDKGSKPIRDCPERCHELCALAWCAPSYKQHHNSTRTAVPIASLSSRCEATQTQYKKLQVKSLKVSSLWLNLARAGLRSGNAFRVMCQDCMLSRSWVW